MALQLTRLPAGSTGSVTWRGWAWARNGPEINDDCWPSWCTLMGFFVFFNVVRFFDCNTPSLPLPLLSSVPVNYGALSIQTWIPGTPLWVVLLGRIVPTLEMSSNRERESCCSHFLIFMYLSELWKSNYLYCTAIATSWFQQYIKFLAK